MPFFKKTRRLLRSFVSLSKGTDVEGTIADISESVALRGSTVWMLLCSSILASIGLDLNSSAVIIGAMLISPLMSPILGTGLGVAILDRKLLRNSLSNLALATTLSLFTSFVYFLISPFGELTSELSARTTPTILDAAIAFFGGIAGVVAGSRSKKTSAVPGVAIATALMPPVCTAGYGLAKFSSTIFLGAFYLYFLNAFLISLATYLMALWLRFPKRTVLDSGQDSNVKRLIIAFSILAIIPSAFIFYNVLNELKFENGIKKFVDREIKKNDRQPIRWEVLDSTTHPILKIYTVGNAVGPDEEVKLENALKNYVLGDLRLNIIQLNVSPKEFSRLSRNVEGSLTDKLDLMQSVDEARGKEIEQLKAAIAEVKENLDPKLRFIKETKGLFPELKYVAWQPPAPDENSVRASQILVLEFNNNAADATKRSITAKIRSRVRSLFPDEQIELRALMTENEAETSNSNANQGR